MNDKTIDRESSKEKVDRIQRLRVEIEHIRQENNLLLKNLDKYDDWLFESIDEINDLLDKNISDDSFEYEEDSFEYDFDPNDFNFGEKRKTKNSTQKKSKKLLKVLNQDNDISINNNTSNRNQDNPKIQTATAPKAEDNQKIKVNQGKEQIETDQKANSATFNLPPLQTPQKTPQENSSPLEVLFRLNPQLAAQILRPFLEEYMKKLNLKPNKKEVGSNNQQQRKSLNQKSENESKTDKLNITQNENENKKNITNENTTQEVSELKSDEPFEDL